jgi:cell division protein FtsQ
MAARAATPAMPLLLPADVRLVNVVASAVCLLAGAGVLAAAMVWATRSPGFALREIELEGELTRTSAATLRANAAPRLRGNFFGVDLQQGRAAFEAVPWVRRAVVRRVWPDRLVVHIEEHRPAALWQGSDPAERGDRIVNTFGEVFQANVGDVEDEALPALAGPEGSAAEVLAMYRRLQPLFAGAEMNIESLQLSGRGSWRGRFDSGAVVELGRGSVDEVGSRSERFVRTLPQVAGRYGQPLMSADLRHADGYALRLRGVTTGGAAVSAARMN